MSSRSLASKEFYAKGDREVNTLTALARVSPPLKWHGGKHYLAQQIVALMPSRCKKPNGPDDDDPGWLHYVEPYAGGLAVLFANDPEGISEVVNDLDGRLTNFWQVLQDDDTFGRFQRVLEAVPFSESEYQSAYRDEGDPVERAVRFFIHCRQSLAGRMNAFAPLSRNRTRRGMNEQASAWMTAVDGLPAVHARLRRVAVLKSQDALNVIRQQDGPRTLFYLDPPYLAETRAAAKVYTHEMTSAQHQALLDVVRGCRGKVMLSGYPSALYDQALAGWTPHEFGVPNQAAGGSEKRRMKEIVWCNFRGKESYTS
jgi:DNA adenine methylase